MKFNNYNDLVNASKEAQKKWRMVPAPQRGEMISLTLSKEQLLREFAAFLPCI
jgi:acyl-CoA reductase-like NAD-dependent aldehyde dehydrogenase